ncbi:methyltransferase [Sphingomonas spermidinifaciens]|uniref:Methyltransferase n=1 Tax=Sphingomonas spermidinifaciens TaxID=1141889 RepID=A0A2A4B8N8_9SPHN|nr:class I SAM-dependent methyltransferase [Sphingomonas spermidinifaciens]PCD04312.1 methyltransferase [Sphingomonas spermidinifaciens]
MISGPTHAGWSDGYVTDLDYTYGYYRELNPAMLRLACLAANVQPPAIDDCTYLELGFGQGVSINMHAAAAPGRFWGIDFNPAHALHARTLAAISEADAALSDDSFASFTARSDLPAFDIIVLHGVWSWISAANRAAILDIIDRRLKPGGIVFVSYNCQPGWAGPMPLRHLMARHVEFAATRSTDMPTRIDKAITFARELAAAGGRYFVENPGAEPWLAQLSGSNRHYLAHEYFNAHWQVDYFSDVSNALGTAKLTYAASARLLDHLPDYALRPSEAQMLGSIAHPVMRESVRDFLVNQKFRMDIFVRGARPLGSVDAQRSWQETAFALVLPEATIGYRHPTPQGELTLDERIYRPVVAFLAEDSYRAKTVAEIGKAPSLSRFDIRELLSALMMLTGLGIAQPARAATPLLRKRCNALNLHLCQQALASADIQVLASPVLGGGKAAPQEHQLVILAILAGMETPDEQALYLTDAFEAHNVTLQREGRAVPPGPAAIGAFRSIAARFEADGHAALLAGLGVLPAAGERAAGSDRNAAIRLEAHRRRQTNEAAADRG